MARARILIADDDSRIRSVLADLFRDEGYAVHTVPDDRESLRSITSASYDLVLTDLDMPMMGGHELARALHDQNITVPLVFMAASS